MCPRRKEDAYVKKKKEKLNCAFFFMYNITFYLFEKKIEVKQTR